MSKYNITNLDELRATRQSLKVAYTLQEKEIADNAQRYIRSLNPMSLLRPTSKTDKFVKMAEKKNLSGGLLSIGLPFLLNKTIFRKSGWLKKVIVGITASKIGKKINIGGI